MDAAWVQAIAAIATFFAAGMAVWATFRAPRIAARFAEELRSANQRVDEERRLKLWVFTTLMQNRHTIVRAHPALNMIDVVFCDAPEVRGAWRHFHAATLDHAHPERIVERYLGIIEKVAADVGLTTRITTADIHMGYYPQQLSELDELQHLESMERLARLRGSNSPPVE